jgi:hypothetical protein
VLRATFFFVVGALFLVGAAGAANASSYPDPAGDAGEYADIVRVDVSEDQTPWRSDLELWATVAGTQPCGEFEGVHVVFALDLDQNPDTGSAFYGTEAELTTDRYGGPVLLRSKGWDFGGTTQPDSGFAAECSPEGAGFGLDPAALGLAPGQGFNVVAVADSPHTDTAPDIGTFNYQPVPGVPPPTLGPDTRAPHIAAVFPARGACAHGKLVRLTYWALDGRGRTAETIRVYRRSHRIATIRRPLGETNPFDLTHVFWRVPPSARGPVRFSVVSVDAAGNRSNVSWGRLVIH